MKPPSAVTVRVTVPVPPLATETLEGLSDREKSAPAVVVFQVDALTRFAALTEPRPVAES